MFLHNALFILALSTYSYPVQSLSSDLSKTQIEFCCEYGSRAHNLSISCRDNFDRFARFGTWIDTEKSKCYHHYEKCCLQKREYTLCDLGIKTSMYELATDCNPRFLSRLTPKDKQTVESCCQYCLKDYLNESMCLKSPFGTKQPYAFKTCCNKLKNIVSWNPCPSGYKLNDAFGPNKTTVCDEIDECKLPKSPCQPFEICLNTHDGSYRCLDSYCPENFYQKNIKESSVTCLRNRTLQRKILSHNQKAASLEPDELIERCAAIVYIKAQNNLSPFQMVPLVGSLVPVMPTEYPVLLYKFYFRKTNESVRSWFYIENVQTKLSPGVLDSEVMDKYSYFMVKTTQPEEGIETNKLYQMKEIRGNQDIVITLSLHSDVKGKHTYIGKIFFHLYVINLYNIA